MNKKIIEEIKKELNTLFYGEIKLIVKKGKIKFIETKKSKKIE